VSHVLHLGDCLDPVSGLASLADKSVAHVLTDPAYEEEAHSRGRRQATSWNGGRGGRPPALKVKAIPYPPITEKERAEVSVQLARVSRGWILVFCQAEALHLWRAALERGGARHVRMGVYRKLDAQPQYSGDRPGVGWEAIEIAWAGKGRCSWNGQGRVAVWEATREFRLGAGGVATTAPVDGAKPLALMERLVLDFTNAGDLICDPYSGSGTTLTACKRLGRNGIGWERERPYYEYATKRIEDAQEVRYLIERLPRPKQLPLRGPDSEKESA
jgi:site-specific DNA-methyltransferase (adenine-specific)